ncbi:MAG: MMPL family transporter [Clostridia bacterium]|nr:MMPL family transporter [Clostridia bacterium]
MSEFFNKIKTAVAGFVVDKKWIFFGVFIAAAIASLCLIPLINVDYDLSNFLSDDSDTVTAMQLMKSEFDDKGMTYAIVQGIDEEKVTFIADDLSKIKGVSNVTYQDMSGSTYRDGNVMYTVTLSSYDASKECFATMKAIESYFDSNNLNGHLTGQSAYSYYNNEETNSSMLSVGIIIAATVILMLFLTSKSYFEMVVMLIVFAMSIALNVGTNCIFPRISYISNLISLILQLALSIDYAVILLHRFMEEIEKYENPSDAAKQALIKAFPEIVSSSLTTIIGLCSLLFMSLKIGSEMGLSLAKSIICSLLPVLFFMPGILVMCSKPLKKSIHKSFIPNVTKPTKAIAKARWIIVPAFIVIVVLSGVGQAFNNYSFNMNGGINITESRQAAADAGYGTLNQLVVIVPKGDYDKERALVKHINGYELIDSSTALADIEISDGVYLTDSYTKDEFISVFTAMAEGTGYDSLISGFGGAIFDLYTESKGLPSDSSVRLVDLMAFISEDQETYESVEPFLGEYASMLKSLSFAKSNLESKNYSRIMFNINTQVEDKAAFELIENIKESIKDFYSEYYIAGESCVCYDMAAAFPMDNIYVSVFTVVFILIILLLTFKNFITPIILTLAIEGGIWVNFVIPFLAHNPVNVIGYLIIMAVQMGATIDYAIVVTNRFFTTKDLYENKLDAVADALNANLPTILTSGTILTVTGWTMCALTSGVVSSIGMLLGVGTLMAMFIVIFVLPSLLLCFEKLISIGDFKKIFKKKK